MHDSRPLVSVPLAELHHTQMTVGAAEVANKRTEWAALKPKERARADAGHWFPAIKGPGGRYFIVDHHHLGLAMHEERMKDAWVMQLEDFSDLETDLFWRIMEFKQWAHPYDQKGRRRTYADIPDRVTGLRNDPYRSLAGFVRRAGGYAKDTAPYAEFLWAEFFRMQPSLAKLAKAQGDTLPPALVQQALTLARQSAARHLPGASGAAAKPAAPAKT
jgi:hypothetical protein